MANVYAIGITPGRTIMDFEAGLEKEVQFKVLNDQGKDMKVLLYVEGEFSKNIQIKEKVIEFKKDESEKVLSYKFKLPKEKIKPGEHITSIIAMEIPSNQSVNGTFIGATVAVATQLKIDVPYPGKYINGNLIINEDKNKKSVNFYIQLKSYGTENVAKVEATIDVYDQSGTKITSLKTNSVALPSGKKKEIITSWDKNFKAGKYTAKVSLIYDGIVDNFEKEFSIGSEDIEFVGISVGDFRLGDIAKFNILVENKWSEELKNTYAQMLILDENQNSIDEFKSASIDILPLEISNLEAYWDTLRVKEGDYFVKLILHYLDKSLEKDFKIKVMTDKIEIKDFGSLSGRAVSGATSGKTTAIVIILVILLVLINLAWFLYLRRKKKLKGKTSR